MNTQATALQSNVNSNEEVKDSAIFEEGLKMSNIERDVLKYLQNNQISKEYKNENDMIKEEIGHAIGPSMYPTVFETDDGQFAVVRVQEKKREKLNKEGLAKQVGISPDELKSPYDYAKLVENGTITAGLIQDFMEENVTTQVSIRKTKKNPLRNMNREKGRR